VDGCVKRSRAVIVLEYILLCKPYRYTAAVGHKMIVIAFCLQQSEAAGRGIMQRVPCVDLSVVRVCLQFLSSYPHTHSFLDET